MAARRMRIKAMASIPSGNRGRPCTELERPMTARSPGPGSPFKQHDGPWSPSYATTPSEERSPRWDSRPGTSFPNENPLPLPVLLPPRSPGPGRRRTISEHSAGSADEMNIVFPPSPKSKRTSKSPEPNRPSPTKSPGIKPSFYPSRPSPSHSPSKSILNTPSHWSGISPIHVPPGSHPDSATHLNFLTAARKSPNHCYRPKSPMGSGYEYNRRPTSPLKSTKSASIGNLLPAPPSPSGSFVPSSRHNSGDSSSGFDQPRRTKSPAVQHNLGMIPSLSEHDCGSSSNMGSGSETLRQRLQKGTTLNTSKYSTSRKEFLIKYMDKKPEPSELTILHYTFWNPPEEGKNRRGSKGEDEEDIFIGSDDPFAGLLNPDQTFKSIDGQNKGLFAEDDYDEKSLDAPPAVGPRVKVGPNGEIIIDEQSLVVETSESQRAKKHLAEIETVSGAGFEVGSSGLYRHKRNPKRGGDWSSRETVRFYRALSSCGTDFSMMTHLFPNRTRAELKSKFKREDRRNPVQISQALACQTFDPTDKMTSSEDDEEEVIASSSMPKKYIRAGGKGKKNRMKKQVEPEPKHFPFGSMTHLNENTISTVHNFAVKSTPKEVRNQSIVNKTSNTEGTDIGQEHSRIHFQQGSEKLYNQMREQKQNLQVPTSVSSEREMDTTDSGQIHNLTSNSSTQEPFSYQPDPSWTPPLQPVYGKRSKPKFPKGRPKSIFHKDAERLPRETLPEKLVPVPTTTTNSINDVRKRKPRKKREKTSKPNNSIIETGPTSASEPLFIRPDILRFDPSDPLGLNIIPNISEATDVQVAEIVLDAPNCGTIPHQIFDIQSGDQVSSSSPNVPIELTPGRTQNESSLVPEGQNQESKSSTRSQRIRPIPRPQPYRVPGPGGKANVTSSRVDEIEIEITCL